MRWTLVCAALAFAATAGGSAAQAQEAIDVAVAGSAGCALYDDGGVWCWGAFGFAGGNLPAAAWEVDPLPPARSIAVGLPGACALTQDGALWCWGHDVRRDEPAISSKPFPVAGLPPLEAVAIGGMHICAPTRDDGRIFCFGQSPFSQLGYFDPGARGDPIELRDLPDAEAVSASFYGSCAALAAGGVTCWGGEGSELEEMMRRPGQEPQERFHLAPETTGRLQSLASGLAFGCGLRDDGRVICWGLGQLGQLGTVDPTLVRGFAGIGEVAGIGAAEDLGAGLFSACAVQAGEVLCWGARPMYGDVELGRLMDPGLTRVAGVEGATRVVVDEDYACAVAAGRVLCWGFEEIEGEVLIAGMAPDRPVPIPGLPGEAAAETVQTHSYGDWRPLRPHAWLENLGNTFGYARLVRERVPDREETPERAGLLYYRLGQELADHGSIELAVEALDLAAERLEPLLATVADDHPLWLLRANIALERAHAFRRQPVRALADLDQAQAIVGPRLEAAPDDPVLAALATDIRTLLVELLRLAERHGETVGAFQSALKAAETWLARAPEDDDLRYRTASLYSWLGRALNDEDRDAEAVEAFAAAGQHYEQLLQGAADDDRRWVSRAENDYESARALRNLERYDEALAALARAQAITGPRFAVAPDDRTLPSLERRIRYLYGEIFDTMERYEEAIAAYRGALEIDPNREVTRRRLGAVLGKTGRVAAAIAEYEAALEIEPGYGRALNALAWLLATTPLHDYRDPDRAVKLAQAAVEEEKDAWWYDTLGAAWLAAGDTAYALKAYRSARETSDSYAGRQAEQLRYLGCLGAGETEPDATALDAALVRCVKLGHPPFVLEEILETAKRIAPRDPDLARRYLEAARAEYPDHPEVIRLTTDAETWPDE